MYIAIVGGGKVGYYLVKTLLERNHKVSLIEKDLRKATKIAEELDIPVIIGDGSDLETLLDAEVDKAHVLAIVTGKDEDNLVTYQIAQAHLSIPRTIVRVNNPKNETVFHKLGIETTVSSTGIIANLIEAEATTEEIKTLLTLQRGSMTLVEVDLKSTSPVIEKSVMEVAHRLPQNCVLVSILRDETVIIPKGNTILKENDGIVAVTTLQNQELLENALLGKSIRNRT